MIGLDEDFSKQKWIEWGAKKSALSVPGSLDFLLYAMSKNVDIFYISNRYLSQLNETVENLKKIGFPNAKEAHLLLKGDISSKEIRRKKVMSTHNIIMLIGDNLSDFYEVLDESSNDKEKTQ